MSCQQASRFIAANNSTNSSASNNLNTNINNITRIVTAEDPYVFTESVPTTPPVLFNTQKSRSRLNELIGGPAISFANVQPQQQQLKITSTQTNGKLAAIKAQASLENTSTTSTLKNVTTQSLANSAAATQNKKVTNVCIVRPQLQQQQQQQQQHHVITSCPGLEGELKSISPPPLYTPTPSLWQTPLLIEAPQPLNHVSTSPPAPALPPTFPLTTSSLLSPAGNVAGNTTLSMTTTPTAMAKVAPIVVHTPPTLQTVSASATSPLTSCLPPSKFHNHTLAHHLQKVECLKKPKKSVQPMPPPPQFCEDLKGGRALTKNCQESPSSLVAAESNGKQKSEKHSEGEELNEIPVNVIFRMALMPAQQQNDGKCKKQRNTKFATTPANNEIATSIKTPQMKSIANRKVSPSTRLRTTTAAATTSPASRINQVQQISTSSKPTQLQQLSLSKSKLPALASKQPNGDCNEIENSEQPQPANAPTPFSASGLSGNEEKPLTKSKTSNIKSISSNNTRKSNANKNVFAPSSHSCGYTNETYSSGCSSSKGAVAVVRLPHHRDQEEASPSSMDISHLASPTGMPYCLQNYWFNSYEFRKPLAAVDDKVLNRSALREERIASYKQQLRRQATQLLSTRSLQKLPLHVARRRLVCVDRLLRKYYKQNEKGLPANVKHCCFSGCDANALEMASHCQQHIVLSAGKEIFLPCTAKFADNTQCRVPVFDITHDLPLCLEHARKRDAYNRLLYEQRPRKISAPPPTAATIYISEGVKGAGGKQQKIQATTNNKRAATAVALQPTPATSRKRKANAAGTGNPVGRPQKRPKKMPEQPSTALAPTVTATAPTTVITSTTVQQLPRSSSSSGLKRKSSTTSLESIASNSQHSTTSSTSQLLQHHQQFYTMTTSLSSQPSAAAAAAGQTSSTLAPPSLAPLSTGFMGNNCLPQHLFSFSHDNAGHATNKQQHSSIISPTTEFKDFISNLTFAPHKTQPISAAASSSYPSTIDASDANFINTNSNSNFTSSGMGGSTTSLATADDFLTQDMLSICENSSASSVDTGLGGLSDPELMLGGPDGDDIPLGDTHLLEEHDLANVLNSLPEDAFKELFATVHQDESDEIERAIELADKHLKTLQQTIGSELGDFLDFNDDILLDNSDICNPAAVTAPNGILDTTSLFLGAAVPHPSGGSGHVTVPAAGVVGGPSTTDVRGLVQT